MSTLLHSLTVRRLITAERRSVFAAFASADALSTWFSPSADIAIELLAFDFTPQGRFSLRYTMPDGSQPVVNGVYEAIEPPERIVFSWIWEAPDPHADVPTRVVVTFRETAGRTDVELIHQRLPKAACERHSAGWQATLERLEPAPQTLSTAKVRAMQSHG